MRRVRAGASRHVRRKIVQRVDGRYRANRHAGAAVDAFDRIDEKLGSCLEAFLILLRMNAVDRARLNA